MTAQLVPLPAGKPAPTTPFSEPWLGRLNKALGWSNGKPILMAGVTVSPLQRVAIQRHSETLKSRLSCGANNRQEIAIELAKLLAAFPAQEQSEAPTDLRIEAYFDALHQVPSWAVAEARLRVIRREVATLNPTFAPTPPEFGDIARRIMIPIRADLSRLEAIYAASGDVEQSAETKQLIGDGFDALAIELGKNDPNKQAKHVPSDDDIRDAAKRWLA